MICSSGRVNNQRPAWASRPAPLDVAGWAYAHWTRQQCLRSTRGCSYPRRGGPPRTRGEDEYLAGLSYALVYSWTPQRRELDYIRYVGACDRTAKEVQLFGLGLWLRDRFRTLAQRYFDENKQLAVRRARAGAGLALVGTFGYYGGYAMILVSTMSGAITLGTMTLLAGAFTQIRNDHSNPVQQARDVYEQSLHLRDSSFSFSRFGLQSLVNRRRARSPGRCGADLSLRMSGFATRAPIVGPLRTSISCCVQGSGWGSWARMAQARPAPTLIARLADPTEGRITLDGLDLRDYDVPLRGGIGVVFQDFVRYADMRMDENIGVGQIEQTRELISILSLDGARMARQRQS